MSQIMAVFYALLFLALASLPAWQLTQYFLHLGKYDRRGGPHGGSSDRREGARESSDRRRAGRG